MAKRKSEQGLGHITERAIELLRQNPGGLTMAQMRVMLDAPAEDQEHFNRRIRHIRKRYHLHLERVGSESVYRLGEQKTVLPPDLGQVTERLRAEVMHAAHGRCQMCGQTISADGIRLQVDHKIPASWGGGTNIDNLWAICEACNRGKRNFFSSFNEAEMREVMSFESVHMRIAHFLRMHLGEPVPSFAIQFVANAIDQQEDWRKRLRDLRYPGIDLIIEVSKKRKAGGGMESFYTLKNWKPLPEDHKRIIREHENKPKSEED